MSRRGWWAAGAAGVIAVVVIGALAAGGWRVLVPRSPEERSAAADRLLQEVRVGVTVTDVSLAAASAIADFGVKDGVRMVNVRIVEKMSVAVRVESAERITFAEAPTLCLVGPDSAPDDAGLEDRCWGTPDLAALYAAHGVTGEATALALEAGNPVSVTGAFSRGDVRCDYPPGTWTLELKANPVIDGQAVGARYVLPDASFDVPWQGSSALHLESDTRYCGLAARIFQEQGEPPIAH